MPNQMIIKCYHYMKEDEIDLDRLVTVLIYNGTTTADICFEFYSEFVSITAGLSWRAKEHNTPITNSFQATNIVMQTIAKFGGQGCATREDILNLFAAQNNADQYHLGFLTVDPALY